LCPNCSEPISAVLFHTSYAGKVLVPSRISAAAADDGESLKLVKSATEKALARGTRCIVKLKVSGTHLRFETVSDDAAIVALRFKRSIQDIVRVDRVDTTRIALTFTPEAERTDKPDRQTIVFGADPPPPETGHIVQLFEMPSKREAKGLYDALVRALAKSTRWSGSFADLHRLTEDGKHQASAADEAASAQA
jgi:hypothetical protein